MNAQFLQRATLILATVLPGSIRGIHLALDLLFGQSRCVGWLQQTLAAGGNAAQHYWEQTPLPLTVLGELDEIFQGRQPCLTVVDGRSFLVLQLQPAAQRDATHWGCTLLDLTARGVEFRDVSADGGRGIAAGLHAAEIRAPFYPDLFHKLRAAHRVTQHLEHQVYATLELEARAERALREAQAPRKRRGRRLKITVPLEAAQQQATQALYHYSAWEYLWQIIRQTLEPWTVTGQLCAPAVARSTLETACALLLELQVPTITTFVTHHFQPALDELLAAPTALYAALQPWQAQLAPDTLSLLLWAWPHRQTLELTTPEALVTPADRAAAQTVWEILSWFHRTSCLAESIHSWLRPHFQAHRGMPTWLLPLLLLVWNHHTFTRGKRQGHSPMELAGLTDVPTLSALFDLLVTPT